MSSDKHCCIPGCKDSGDMHQVLHKFPNPEKEKDRFNAWLYAIGTDILGLEDERIYIYRRVCHAHFEAKYICRYKRLSNIAMPTLNIPGPLSPVRLRFLQSSTHILKPMRITQAANEAQTTSLSGSLLPKLMIPHQTYSKRMPLQEIINQPEPSTSSGPSLFHGKTMTSINIETVTPEENIASTTSTQQFQVLPAKKLNQEILGKRSVTKKITQRVFLTVREKELLKKIAATRVKLSKIKNKSQQQMAQIKAAKKLSANPALINCFENSTSTAKLIIQLQSRENKKAKKGRRFTLNEKIAALAIFKQSPKGYRFLRRIFILPAQQTLIKLIQNSNIKPGLNKNIFSQLKKKADSMKTAEKLCVVLFDEISIKANMSYQERKGKITGVVDNGQERMAEFADHAQVFMVRGLIHNYKQPVYYTFSKNCTKGPELAKQIKDVVKNIQEAGLIVVATVCDQGANNRHAMKLLLNETRGYYLRNQEEPKENVIVINKHEIIPLYDTPHLLKGMRNNLMTKDLKYAINGITKTAKWSHLQLLLKENPGYKGIRLIPKLTEYHVNPEKMNKMKVKFATQVFSRTVASNMGYLADKGILPEECKETADLLLFLDNIFDSVNGSHIKNKHAKPLLGPVTSHSCHHKTWEEGKKIFKTMIFVKSDGRKETVPSVENWVWTLDGIELLLKKINTEYGISSVWMRHLNQDPLENFFGSVRSHGCRNVNPTCEQYESAYATLLINNLNSVHTPGKNCEADLCNSLHALIVNDNAESTSSDINFDISHIINFQPTPLEAKENDPRIIAPIQYMSGYFLKKAKSNVFKTCTECISDLSSNNEIEYIKYREYAGRRWLCTPSKELITLVSNMQDLIN